MNNIQEISFWKQNFGLLPMRLFSIKEEESFIMLNGSYGNFCLEVDEAEKDIENYYSFSWSSNTKNFVVLGSESVKVFNWKRNKSENISRKQVEENHEKFYEYLSKNSYKSESDVVPFVVDIFKQFRNLTQEKGNAIEALNLLFLLLISIEEDVENINLERWGFDRVEIPDRFEMYTEKLRLGFSNIKPNLDLIIRHSSGILFQEAQKEALFFDSQLDLWGFPSAKLSTKKLSYSSLHYTPPYLARTIVESSIRELDLNKPLLKVFDPACGSGEFLIEALKQLKEYRYLGRIQIIGWDSSETAISISKFLLKYEQSNIWTERMSFEIKLVENSLEEEWDNDYDLILMNPPFVSWEQMTKQERNSVLEVLNLNTKGRPNLAGAFFYKAIQSLNENGVIGCVIPSSLLSLSAYQKLRYEIHDLIDLMLIGKLGNFVFEDALTDVSLIIGKKPKSESSPLILWTKNEKGVVQNALRDLRKIHYLGLSRISEKNYSIYKPMAFPISKESWKLISFDENEFLKTVERFVIEGKLFRVQDIFNVQQGIRTGHNQAFKLSKDEYTRLPDNEKQYFRPVIDNDSIDKGKISTVNYIWYPYNKNGITINTEEELRFQVPTFYQDKLVKFKGDLVNKVQSNPEKWWQLNRHRAWLSEEKPRLVSTEFGKSDSFAFDEDGVFAIERGNAWLPKKEFKDVSFYYFYLSVFSSSLFDRLLSIYSRQLAGGSWYDLGKTHTKDLPIPNILSKQIRSSDSYAQLVDIGKELSNGNYYLKTMLDDILMKYIYPSG